MLVLRLYEHTSTLGTAVLLFVSGSFCACVVGAGAAVGGSVGAAAVIGGAVGVVGSGGGFVGWI